MIVLPRDSKNRKGENSFSRQSVAVSVIPVALVTPARDQERDGPPPR